jgi:hypothetical protein
MLRQLCQRRISWSGGRGVVADSAVIAAEDVGRKVGAGEYNSLTRGNMKVKAGGGVYNSLTVREDEGQLCCLVRGLRHREIIIGTPS